ncbi:hypothetical protein OIB37_01995 [Streptomyces sp. NBC_00820]|uniref:hypothetical protein n=1 Tax=Streptomyces sp. NBC_00820 TaxID=2975842 RepID=UPI002ED36D96|nr:hypothetical protein OIB37_01995 [Streptomyces sp. NBC_00820]
MRAVAETAMVYGLLGWLYVAVVAAIRPDDLAGPVSALVPVRRDTCGAVCFAVSATAALALQTATGTWWFRAAPRRGPLIAVLRVCTGYGLLVWAYLCVNSLTHPATLSRPLTHFAAVPREGQTASWAFVVSAAALVSARALARPAGTGGGTS